MIDMQSSIDYRNIPIRNVGVKNVKCPVLFTDSDTNQTFNHSVSVFSLFVGLPQEKKGTHMSRFLSILYDYANKLSINSLVQMSSELNEKLESENSYIQAQFPFFFEKLAPVSKTKGMIDVEVSVEVENKKSQVSKKLSVVIPIKSLCPCSKAISEYGAHSQRGLITISIWDSNLSIRNCIEFAENAASSPIYSILKREDEKYVTEKAYNTPRFVEDLVRETAYLLKEKAPNTKFEITAENFESIHNHNAWAQVCSDDFLR